MCSVDQAGGVASGDPASMSGTIAAIRVDTESVATDIDRLEAGFRSVDGQLARLETTTGDFVARIAA